MLEKKVNLIKKRGILPRLLFNNLLVTAEKQSFKGGIIVPGITADTYLDVQEVLEVGPNVSDIKVGDYILLDVTHFYKRGTNSLKEDLVKEYHEVVLPVHKIGDLEAMLISDRDIIYYWCKEDIKDL